MRRIIALFIAFILLAPLFCSASPCFFAEEPETVLQVDEIEDRFQNYVSSNGLDENLISVAYCYTSTGETWYHLENIWYYSASLYKVPLMMVLAEKEHDGELSRESLINGMTLENIEQEVLTNSNNPIAYSMLLWLGQPDQSRRLFCRYATLPEEYYTWDFFGSSYFTARYMSDVMQTLYYAEPERFPRVIDCLKGAQPGHYFHLKLGDDIEIAQKYGSLTEDDGREWNHTSGIVFTPNPFILTVMTRYGGISETIIADLAVIFRDLTLEADARLVSKTSDGEKHEATDILPGNPAGDKNSATSDRRTEEAVSAIPEISKPEMVPSNQSGVEPYTTETEVREPDSQYRQGSNARIVLLLSCMFILMILTSLKLVLRPRKKKPKKRMKRIGKYRASWKEDS